jgi:DHA1 family bicyclomycin/chloramphenicol resistance-like MFS transporter
MTTPHGAGDRRPPPGLMLVLAALAALATLSTNIMLPAFPGIAHGLRIPVEAMGATFSVFFIGFALAQLFVGPLSDRLGRGPVAVAGIALVVAGSVVCALAQDFVALLAGLDAAQFGGFFAGTVLVVFAAGALAPRLATRLGTGRALRAGLATGLAGGLAMLALGAAGVTGLPAWTAAVCVFLLGMGVANPVGTAVAMGPVGDRAGQASALLGFLQMTMAIGAGLAGALPMAPVAALGLVMSAAMAAAVLVFGLRDRRGVAARAPAA